MSADYPGPMRLFCATSHTSEKRVFAVCPRCVLSFAVKPVPSVIWCNICGDRVPVAVIWPNVPAKEERS